MRLVQGPERLADPFAELAHERGGLGRDHRNLSVLFAQAGGDLEPDETAAENDGAGSPAHVGENRRGVFPAAKHVNARQIRARNIERLGNAAGRYQRAIERSTSARRPRSTLRRATSIREISASIRSMAWAW